MATLTIFQNIYFYEKVFMRALKQYVKLIACLQHQKLLQDYLSFTFSFFFPFHRNLGCKIINH